MAMMAASRPSPYTSRPAYLDRMFTSDDPHRPTTSTTTTAATTYPPTSPSLRSTNSSISFSSASPLDFRATQSHPRPLSPAFEESASAADDRLSVRSLRLTLSPRHKLKSLLHRRTYPQIQETLPDFDDPDEIMLPSRRPSLPKLHTAFPPHPPSSHRRRKPLPPAPPRPLPQELNCGRCYYFHARNCNGYVMGGAHGDACDNCAAAGFFGAP